MNSNVSKALEMGLGFMLFVIGLSVLITMNASTTAYIGQGRDSAQMADQVLAYEGGLGDKSFSIYDLYMLLTDETMQPEAVIVGGVTYGTPAIEVYIDGVLFPAVSDYDGRQSLKGALGGLTFSDYDLAYVADVDGNLTEMHFTGR